MKRLLSLASKLKYNLDLDVWEAMCIIFICKVSIIQGHVSFSFRCENFTYYKWYPQGFLNIKVDVSASFSCGKCTYDMFPNRFLMLKLFGITKFHQVSVDGNSLEFGHPRIPQCGNFLYGLELCGNHRYT